MRSLQDTIIGAAVGFLAAILLLAPGDTNSPNDATREQAAQPRAELASQAASAGQPSTSDRQPQSTDTNNTSEQAETSVPMHHAHHQTGYEADLNDPRFIDTVLAVAEDVDPELGKRLHDVCGREPQEFAQIVKQAGRHLIGLAQLRLRDPELYKLKIAELQWEPQAMELARDWHEAVAANESARAAELNEQLTSAVQTHMLLILKARGEYILRLEEHVKHLKEQLDQFAGNFPERVEQRVEQLKQRAAEESKSLAADQ